MDGQKDKENLSVKEVEPEVIAQKCPVCNGFGTLKYGQKTCQACDGKGYILVPLKLHFTKEGNNE